MESANSPSQSAKSLLSAWNSASRSRIVAAIDQVCSRPFALQPSVDAERAEMLQEIGQSMRAWLDGEKTVADLDACLELLRHMASSNRMPVRDALRPGMRACARN